MTSGIQSGSLEHRGIHNDGDEAGEEGSGTRAVDIILHRWKFPREIPRFGQFRQKLPPPVPKVWLLLPCRLIFPEFLKLRPNSACMLLFCSAALQLRRADSTKSDMRAPEERDLHDAKCTIFEVLGRFDAGLPEAFGVTTRVYNQIACFALQHNAARRK